MQIYRTLPNGIQIVEYEESLAPTLADMWNKSREDWGGGSETKTPGNVAARIAGAAIINHYVALADGEAVGYCSLGRYFGDADALYIELLGVRPDYQGKKVGKALVLECVNRTIELGYPRIDIHTWSGNTKSVPLYKKCGYLWEDRADSTHLVNFIPEILNTPLFKGFFAKADWYTDSTRSWDIKPDGMKENKFEVFGYTWEKDGKKLAVGYERTGRRMRLIETDDYKIELMAENHELAFGLSYGCTFSVENKSGRELHIKINGRQDRNIKFDFSLDTYIKGKQSFPAAFYVGEITALQDKWKVHPCLLADVEINGQAVVFGLGIMPKYPLDVSASAEATVLQKGLAVKTFINIRSALLQDAEVIFAFPENKLISFPEKKFTAKLPAGGKAHIPTVMHIRGAGYEAIPIRYDITLADGKSLQYTTPFHQVNQDLTHAFAGENEYNHFIVHGPWRVGLSKHDNEAFISHLTNQEFSRGWFDPPKLGKPYDDEFNLLKPVVRAFLQGTDMVMEAEYISEKFTGMALTMIFTLSPSGIISRRYRIENRGTAPREVFLNDNYWFALGGHTVFRYRGQFTQNYNAPVTDGPHYGIEAIEPDDAEENWIFEAAPGGGRGFCWPPEVKPCFQWGNMAKFEFDAGRLEVGQVYETLPVVYVYGLFNNFGDFRNYAMGLWDKKNIIPARRVEVRLNGYNPVVHAQAVALDIVNNRETVLEGTIRVSSDAFEPQEHTNPPAEEPTTENHFTLPLTSPINELALVRVDMLLASYEKSYDRVLFAPSGEVKRTQEGSVYTVDNGKIAFRADPQYGPVCFSLTTPDGSEWLTHQHPEHKPFAWWNPFFGGIRMQPPNMNNMAILKEETTTAFAEATDNFGNRWQGVCTMLTCAEDDELRGAVYETYFMTLPGVPILCAFYRFINHTGVYRRDTLTLDAFLNPAGEGEPFYGELANRQGHKQRILFNSGANFGYGVDFENTVKLCGARPQHLYIFHGNKNNGKHNEIEGDNKTPALVNVYMEAIAAPGKAFTSSPVFFLLTGRDIPQGALDDLERVAFD